MTWTAERAKSGDTEGRRKKQPRKVNDLLRVINSTIKRGCSWTGNNKPSVTASFTHSGVLFFRRNLTFFVPAEILHIDKGSDYTYSSTFEEHYGCGNGSQGIWRVRTKQIIEPGI